MKKDLLTVRDYSYRVEEIGYYESGCVSAKDYATDVSKQLRQKITATSPLMTVNDFAQELLNSQYEKEESKTNSAIEKRLQAKERIEKAS